MASIAVRTTFVPRATTRFTPSGIGLASADDEVILERARMERHYPRTPEKVAANKTVDVRPARA
jgi:hypothetical protein